MFKMALIYVRHGFDISPSGLWNMSIIAFKLPRQGFEICSALKIGASTAAAINIQPSSGDRSFSTSSRLQCSDYKNCIVKWQFFRHKQLFFKDYPAYILPKEKKGHFRDFQLKSILKLLSLKFPSINLVCLVRF